MGERIIVSPNNNIGWGQKYIVLDNDVLMDKGFSIEEKMVAAYDRQRLPYESQYTSCSTEVDLNDSAISRARERTTDLGIKEYLVIDPDLFKNGDLDLVDVVVLSRILTFDGGYCETISHCAEFLGITPKRISDSRKKLIELNLIEEFARDGKTILQKASKEKTEVVIAPQITHSAPTKIVASSDDIHTATMSYDKQFRKDYKEYIEAWDAGIAFIKQHHITYNDKRGLQKAFAGLVGRYKDDTPEDVVDTLLIYYRYLDSSQYLYQVEKNKYCPRINKSTDLFDKFKQIADFKNNPNQHYDPSRVLTFGD